MIKSLFSLLIILLFATQFVLAQSNRSWQLGLEGRVGDYWLSHGVGNVEIEKQYVLRTSLDRSFNKYLGGSLSIGYVHISDEQNFLSSSDGRRSFDAANAFKINIFSLNFSPTFTLSFKRNSAISLRPYGGIGLLKAKQQMFYTFNDGSASSSKSEIYNYSPNWMPIAGLFGEYILQFSPKWAAFISIGYEHLFALSDSYQFDHKELPYAEFPLNWQSAIRDIREVNDEWDTDLHQFRDITAPQLGVGVRLRFSR